MIKRCHGQYTMEQVQHCGQMGGPFKKEMSRLLMYGVGAQDTEKAGKKRSPKYVSDLVAMVNELKEDRLFHYQMNKCHKGFEQFESQELSAGYTMGHKLRELSKNLDRWKRIRQSESKNYL